MPQIASKLSEIYFDFWWTDPIFEISRRENKDKFCLNKQSPLKIEVSNYLRSIKEQLTSVPLYLEEIELLREAKISGIITTNWDQFLENIFKDFTTYVGQDELLFSGSQGVAEIYKIHGCCSNPNSLVLTEADYNDFHDRNPYLAAKLLTIFTEHPIIFLGYSLSDPNIINILKSITYCLKKENISKLQDRLIFVKRCDAFEKERKEKTFITFDNSTIHVTVIYVKDFIEIFKGLKELKIGYSAKILRQLRKDVYELVVSNEIKEKLYVMDIDEETDMDDVQIVFGVGAINRIKETGYRGITRLEIYEDIVFDSKNYDCYQIIEQSLESIISRGKYVPIFKYLRTAGYISDSNTLLFRQSLKSFDEDGIENKLIRIPERLIQKFDETINEGIAYFHPAKHYHKHKDSMFKLSYGLDSYEQQNGIYKTLTYYSFFNPDELTSEKLETFLKDKFPTCFNSSNSHIKSEFQKMICLHDYVKYYLQK